MKYIKKVSHNHQDVINFENIDSNSVWGKMNGNIKKKLKTILINEQQNKCAYCEKKLIPNKNKITYCHIEHIKARLHYENETYKYDNVVVSCGDYYKNKNENKNKHCGYTKDDYNIKDGFISPLSSDCSSYFKYSLNGKILSTNEKNSCIQATIDCLNLNSANLVDLRSRIIDMYDYKGKAELIKDLQNLENSEAFYNCIRYIIDYTIKKLNSK